MKRLFEKEELKALLVNATRGTNNTCLENFELCHKGECFILDLYFPSLLVGVLIRSEENQKLEDLLNLSAKAWNHNSLPVIVFDCFYPVVEGIAVLTDYIKDTLNYSEDLVSIE